MACIAPTNHIDDMYDTIWPPPRHHYEERLAVAFHRRYTEIDLRITARIEL